MSTSEYDAYVHDTFGVNPATYAAPAAAPKADAVAEALPVVGQGGGTVQPLDTSNTTAPCSEQPIFTDSSPIPIDVMGDNIEDFITNVNVALKGNPHCNIDVSWQSDTDSTGKVTAANLTVATAILVPRLGLSRATGTQRDLINKAVTLITDHEKRHRAIARDVYGPAPCAIVGKDGKQADALLAPFATAHTAAQAAFDKDNGLLKIVYDANNVAIDVVTGPL